MDAPWDGDVSVTLLTLTSDLVSRMIMFGVSLLYFKVGIPYSVRGCIMGWKSVAFHFGVTDLDL